VNHKLTAEETTLWVRTLAEYLTRARKSNEQINSNEVKLAEQQVEIETKEENVEELGGQLSALTSQRDEITKRIESGISNEKERNERVKAIELDM
jgi:chromosome segregation ATPase